MNVSTAFYEIGKDMGRVLADKGVNSDDPEGQRLQGPLSDGSGGCAGNLKSKC